MLAKAAALRVDEVVLDFEDSAADDKKTAAARAELVAVVNSLEWGAPSLALRVNGYGSPWFDDDVADLVRPLRGTIGSVVVPKVDSSETVRAVRRSLDAVGSTACLQLLIESARGVVEVDAIGAAAAAGGVEALLFGPGDYAASLGQAEPVLGGRHERFPGDRWQYARSRVVNAAHAFGLDAIDGPYAAFADEEGLRLLADQARLLGFTGKWAIHPAQVPVLTEVFTPTQAEVQHARSVIAALGGEPDGAAAHGGVMIDAASVRMARRVLEHASGA